MDNYTFLEYVDMRLILGKARGNGGAAVSLYTDRYPQRRLPKPLMFLDVDRRIRETGRRRSFALSRDELILRVRIALHFHFCRLANGREVNNVYSVKIRTLRIK
jgi:hypothetical protein